MPEIILILLVLALSFANGSNDVSKGIATLTGCGLATYRKALVWGTLWTIGGSLAAGVFSVEMVNTFAVGLLRNPVETQNFASLHLGFNGLLPISVAFGALVWVLFASLTGLPVSTTHAIIGAICGVGVFSLGYKGVSWDAVISKMFIPLFVSPFCGLFLAFLIYPPLRLSMEKLYNWCVCFELKKEACSCNPAGTEVALLNTMESASGGLVLSTNEVCEDTLFAPLKLNIPDIIHWLSSGLVCFARGLNDAPKIVAIGLTISLSSYNQVFTFAMIAVTMGLGSYLGGLRVTQTLAEKVTKMNHIEGLSANLITSLLVGAAARFGLPVSTTHISSSAIIGIGLKHGRRGICWNTVFSMVLAWFVTLPVSGILSAIAYYAFLRIL
ncbi:MAG TPA: inorganic phosphate transporter [Candidatus Brocadiia bacterium]|nr:inorganic phosphate transporter [Planctomycetota bacterium]MDO8092549.1 inorganic phosphate transporter [Candidatus Brocadiales bacterium]